MPVCFLYCNNGVRQVGEVNGAMLLREALGKCDEFREFGGVESICVDGEEVQGVGGGSELVLGVV